MQRLEVRPGSEGLTQVVRDAFGPERALTGVTRLRGGSKKGVHRLEFAGGAPTAVLYVWHESENYWSHLARSADDRPDPLRDASGIDMFADAQELLDGLGVPVPRVHLLDRERGVAVVEDMRGGTLEDLLERDPARGEAPLAVLAEALTVMHGHRRAYLGQVGWTEGGDRSCERIVLDHALRDLAEAARRVERLGAVRHRLEETVRELAAAVRPRAEYALIHGELGPDHVFLDERDRPVLIDLENLMFFDVEWEHVFLRLRFGEERYPRLHRPGLDHDRLRFYGLAQRLSLVAGPLSLLDGDFPDREFMLRIAQWNTERALDFLDQRKIPVWPSE